MTQAREFAFNHLQGLWLDYKVIGHKIDVYISPMSLANVSLFLSKIKAHILH